MKKKLLIIIISIFPFRDILAQHKKSFSFEGKIISTTVDDYVTVAMGYIYSYWLNPYIGGAIGANVSLSKIEFSLGSPFQNNISYSFEDEKYLQLNATAGLRLATPELHHFGLLGKLDFSFSPIPFDAISYTKSTYSQSTASIHEVENNKYVYNRFNPSFFAEVGAYYTFHKDNNAIRISLGGGLTNFNPFNGYYYAEIDKIKLRNKHNFRLNKLGASIYLSLEFIGFIF